MIGKVGRKPWGIPALACGPAIVIYYGISIVYIKNLPTVCNCVG